MTDQLKLIALPGIPLVEPGDDLVGHIQSALQQSQLSLQHGDCLVIAQKVVSKAENRYAYLNQVEPTKRAQELAVQVDKDPRLVQLILDESVEVLRFRPGVIIVEHRLGYVHANAGIDRSNISQDADNPRVLLLPESPDQSASALRMSLEKQTGIKVNIVISDSAGRAWREGIAGFAIGTAGFMPVADQSGQDDLFGRQLEVTEIAIADELAAAASILMGQAAQASPVILIRGAMLTASEGGSERLIRAREKDLFH